ncbi:MAG: Acylphosphatase [Chlamydiae bacterium]|nr:Acylphosphatase [Chlamydiota bacterium]
MSSESKTFHIIVKGSVQGVGFRSLVKHHADKLGLSGTVKNLSNGTVEIYVQGDEDRVSQLTCVLKEGKGLAKAEHINVDDDVRAPKEYQSFEIVF